MRWYRTIVGVLIVAVAAILGCASGSRLSPGERVAKDAAMCLKTSPTCTTLHVDNSGLSDANLYLNGGRFGFVGGMTKATIFLPEWRLGADRCVSIFIRLNPIGLRMQADRFQTTRECIGKGGSFDLHINPMLKVSTLTPRVSR